MTTLQPRSNERLTEYHHITPKKNEEGKKNSICPIKFIDCIVQFDMIIIQWTAKWAEKWERERECKSIRNDWLMFSHFVVVAAVIGFKNNLLIYCLLGRICLPFSGSDITCNQFKNIILQSYATAILLRCVFFAGILSQKVPLLFWIFKNGLGQSPDIFINKLPHMPVANVKQAKHLI